MRRSGPAWRAAALTIVLWFSAGAPTDAQQSEIAVTTPPSTSPSPAASASPTALPASNPFPSPSASTAAPGNNGYAAAGYVRGSASGGTIQPAAGSTAKPAAFPSSTGTGFWVDILGRLGSSYAASLSYENYSVAGGDRPLVSFAQLHALFAPPASKLAFGLGLLSAARSTANFNLNAVGLGVHYLPNFQDPVTPYASLFIYPHVQTLGTSSAFVAADAGLMIVPARRGGFFVRVGGSLRSGIPNTSSPTSITALDVGIGTAF